MRYAAIEFFRDRYPLERLCAALSVSCSGFHQWRRRRPSARQQANERLLERIRQIHASSRGAYGSPRIHRQLRQEGFGVSKERVRRLMRAHHIVGRHRRRFCRTTQSDHSLLVAPNRLGQQFACSSPNTVWLADITYVPTDEGFLYVAAMKDLCTKKIVGWSMSEGMPVQLVLDALTMAVERQRPAAGVLVHSDRGVQYATSAFRLALSRYGMTQSMSRRGNCYDNAPMESFFASLKIERLDQERLRTRSQAKAAVFDYIETFYNPVRLHSAIGYEAPNRYEERLRAS